MYHPLTLKENDMTGLSYYNQTELHTEAARSPELRNMIGISMETGITNIKEVFYA
jgi:hypothetical protein